MALLLIHEGTNGLQRPPHSPPPACSAYISTIQQPRPGQAGSHIFAIHLRVLRMKQKILGSLLKRCVRIWRCSGLVAPSSRT